jgi:hypothetical protein
LLCFATALLESCFRGACSLTSVCCSEAVEGSPVKYDSGHVQCRIVQSTTSPLLQPIHTRWATYLNMLSSLIKHRSSLIKAVKDSEFDRLARAARSGMDSLAEEVEADQHLKDLTDALSGVTSSSTSVPEGVSRNPKFATVYKSVEDPRFWKAAEQYVALNSPVAAAITSLSSDSACLSDAVLYTNKISAALDEIEFSPESRLFDSEHQVAELKRLWSERAEHVGSFAHLALLLDPRPVYRKFVQSEVAIVGSAEGRNIGNIPFIASADSALRQMADFVLPDQHKTVQQRHAKNKSLSLVDVKAALLSGPLRAFVGVHETKTLKHVGVDGEGPVSFWLHQVPEDCLLREAAVRVMSAKPSSTAVERLWNSSGDNLTAKRRSMKNSTLATIVYAKMNNHLLDNRQASGMTDTPGFESLLDFVDEMHEEELLQQSKGGVQCDQRSASLGAGTSDSSGSGDADSW